MSARSLTGVVCLAGLLAGRAAADEPDKTTKATKATTSDPNEPQAEHPAPGSQERASSIEPKPAEAPPPGRTRFEAEPLRDGAVIAMSVGFAGLLELIIGTGEVQPQEISKNFSTDSLLAIDRAAATQTVDPYAGTYSNLAVIIAMGYAIVDPIVTGIREKNVQSAITDGFIYAQSIAVTWAVTNLAKIAVRRPRPRAYIEAEMHKDDPNYVNTQTDTALSFFSGHSSITAAIVATSTYLAFARSPDSVRPWLTLGGGTALLGVVAYGRIRSGAHFPTDVIAGIMAGAGIGILVPHFHRLATEKQRPLWIGYAPELDGPAGGVLTLSGQF